MISMDENENDVSALSVNNQEELLKSEERFKRIIDGLTDYHYTVMVDKAMASTVVRNILANAVKYTRRKGSISIQAEKDKSMIRISVKDDGLGMDQETLSCLFAKDKKRSVRGTEGERGTGLGLLLCREFVEKHGGQIRVESKPGQGSVFMFILPDAGEDNDE